MRKRGDAGGGVGNTDRVEQIDRPVPSLPPRQMLMAAQDLGDLLGLGLVPAAVALLQQCDAVGVCVT